MFVIDIISNGVQFELIPSENHVNEFYLANSGGSRILGRIIHHLPLGWSGQTLRDHSYGLAPLIRASRLDAIQDLIEANHQYQLRRRN